MAYTITAVPDIADGAVNVTVRGGTPGEPLYIFRRDSAGVGVVRDTSAASVLWPSAGALAYTNLMPNPDATGGTTTTTAVVGTMSVGPALSGFLTSHRHTRNSAGGAVLGVKCGTAIAPTTQYTVLVALRASVAMTGVQLNLRPDVASGTGNVPVGGPVSLAAGVVTVVEAVVTTTATAMTVNAGIMALWSSGAVGSTLDMVATIVAGDASAQLSGPFSGAYSWDAAYVPAWTGTPGASTSILSASVSVVIVDNEARQGEMNVDYLLADGDGVMLASVRVALPLWGTWLKSPGRPYLNTRCHLELEGPVKRPARREVVPIEGSTAPIVLSQPRAGRSGTVRLVALTGEMADAVSRLLDQGDTLMLDTDPAWRLAFRYVNVGDVTVERSYWTDRGLEIPARTFDLGDLVAVEAPIGVTAVEVGRTYATLPTLFGSYAAMAATVSTYEELATGVA